ncbi:plasmid segregation actin-type ATPase ParM [Caldanaerobius fijiensis DSM 17918]|uniref:Plasmid segregation actin-type ATPase ParM n=1 Tax=Caldanaerobius fijiensis DSM 17918 TaxID=1121256 RepID=A0A1M5F8U7_9THEO|nr:ParM/StbA family protein [Caldanaerobius fijiensis]SHF87808.1 plasmid segregation actin-type ATPase ParM [Caldanaerobius fijiensis DSM 17918]
MFKIGLDLGYGYVKGINEKGKRVIFPSLVSMGHDRSLSKLFQNSANIMDNLHVSISDGRETQEYFVGELARNESKTASFVFDENKINHPNTRVLLATACALLMPDDDSPVHIVTGLPLEQYMHGKEEFLEMLKSFKAIVSIADINRSWIVKFDKVTLFPQAAGAVYYSMWDNISRYLAEGGYIGLIDIGFKTTDYIVFKLGKKILLQNEMSNTINTGMSDLYDIVGQLFSKKTGVMPDTRVAMEIVENGGIMHYGKKVDMSKEIQMAKEEVARIIKNRIKMSWSDEMSMFNTVFLAGGGAKELEEHLMDIYPRTVLVNDPQMANARGFLKVAEIQEKNEK